MLIYDKAKVIIKYENISSLHGIILLKDLIYIKGEFSNKKICHSI